MTTTEKTDITYWKAKLIARQDVLLSRARQWLADPSSTVITSVDDSMPAHWVSVDGERVVRSAYDESDTRYALIAQISDEYLRRAAAIKDRASAERDAWIRERGSERLRLGLAAGMIEKMHGVYITERLAVEAPEWRVARRADQISSRINPAIEELRALLEARQIATLSDVTLVTTTDSDDDDAEWSPALRATWRRDTDVIRVL